MSTLAGKKVLCFIALDYHNRTLLPIMKTLEENGAQITYCTSAAEAAFEITLREAGLPYLHTSEMLTPSLEQQASASYRQVRDQWHGLLLTSPALQSVPLVIQDKSIRNVIEAYYGFEEMIRRVQPDVVFALHEINAWGKLLGYLCHREGIPFVTFQEGLCYGATPMYQLSTEYSSACICWGEADKAVLVAAGCDPEKIYPFGNVDLWSTVARVLRPEVQAETRQALGVEPGEKVIVFLMGHSQYAAFDSPGLVQWLWKRPNYKVLFKFHPITEVSNIVHAVQHIKHIPSVQVIHTGDTALLIGIADVCVLIGISTTGIEALMTGKPLIQILLDGSEYSFVAQGVALPAVNFEDVGAVVDRVLQEGIAPAMREQVVAYKARSFAYWDGQTVERVVELVETMLK